VLEDGVPVLASDGQQVGTVGSVLSAPEEDVFHGLLINTPGHGIRFLEADAIASITNTASICGSTQLPLRISRARAQGACVRRGSSDPDQVEPLFRKYTGRKDWRHER